LADLVKKFEVDASTHNHFAKGLDVTNVASEDAYSNSDAKESFHDEAASDVALKLNDLLSSTAKIEARCADIITEAEAAARAVVSEHLECVLQAVTKTEPKLAHIDARISELWSAVFTSNQGNGVVGPAVSELTLSSMIRSNADVSSKTTRTTQPAEAEAEPLPSIVMAHWNIASASGGMNPLEFRTCEPTGDAVFSPALKFIGKLDALMEQVFADSGSAVGIEPVFGHSTAIVSAAASFEDQH
jgi:hypothetical protein